MLFQAYNIVAKPGSHTIFHSDEGNNTTMSSIVESLSEIVETSLKVLFSSNCYDMLFCAEVSHTAFL